MTASGPDPQRTAAEHREPHPGAAPQRRVRAGREDDVHPRAGRGRSAAAEQDGAVAGVEQDVGAAQRLDVEAAGDDGAAGEGGVERRDAQVGRDRLQRLGGDDRERRVAVGRPGVPVADHAVTRAQLDRRGRGRLDRAGPDDGRPS